MIPKISISTIHRDIFDISNQPYSQCYFSSAIHFYFSFIQFSVNHFYFYSVLVQAFTIISVLIQFSFLINQIYEMYCYSTVSIQLKILLFSFTKTSISKFFYSRFRLPAVSIPQREKMHSTYASDAGADNKSNASGTRLWYIA